MVPASVTLLWSPLVRSRPLPGGLSPCEPYGILFGFKSNDPACHVLGASELRKMLLGPAQMFYFETVGARCASFNACDTSVELAIATCANRPTLRSHSDPKLADALRFPISLILHCVKIDHKWCFPNSGPQKALISYFRVCVSNSEINVVPDCFPRPMY